jgi:uncharacterized protein YciI
MRLFFLALLALSCFAQQSAPYVFGFLRAHPQRRAIPEAEAVEIQKGHMAHLGMMGREHKLIGAGPLGESTDIRGILIFKGASVEEARAAASQDPAVLNQRLVVDLFSWPIQETLGEKAIAKMKEGPDAKWSMNKRSIVIYSRTAAWPADLNTPENKAALEGHGAFLQKIRAGGQLLVVGPLMGSKEFVGVAIYRSANPAEVLKFSEEDPFVRSGWVKAQGFPLFIADEVF